MPVGKQGELVAIDKAETEDERSEVELRTILTDEAYEELAPAKGKDIVGIAYWNSSLVDTGQRPENLQCIDMKVHLGDGARLELFGTSLFPSLSAEPVTGIAALETAIAKLADGDATLQEIAQSEDGELILVVATKSEASVFLTVEGWTVGLAADGDGGD